MIKRTLYFLAFAGCIASCQQTADYKLIRDEVVKIHDSVMVNTENAYLNKRALDTLATRLDSLKKAKPALDTAKEKVVINNLRHQLEEADTRMSDWMHQFEADKGSKSDAEAVAYFNNEKSKISSIDSLYVSLLKTSNEYLSQLKK